MKFWFFTGHSHFNMQYGIVLASAALLTGAGAQTLQLTGRVLESADRQPVPGAAVSWSGSQVTATTDSLGGFALTGSAERIHSPFLFQTPYVQGDHFNITTATVNQTVVLRVFTVRGECIASQSDTFPAPGRKELPVLPNNLQGCFLGFIEVSSLGQAYTFRVLRMDSPASQTSVAFVTSPFSSAQSAVVGWVNISMPGLLTQSLPVNSYHQNLGDIELGYPLRSQIGVGAPPPYGAIKLFDGSQGRAAAMVQLQSLWKPWWRFQVAGQPGPTTGITFTLASDPQYPHDTTHVTLQTCCPTAPSWGYDDLQSKIVHGDAQLHVEWISMGRYDSGGTAGTAGENPDTSSDCFPGQNPEPPCYFNSGVYVQSRHEIQLESNALPPAPIRDPASGALHALGAIVGEETPGSNQFKGNGQWEAYDITFRTARYLPGHHSGPGDTLGLISVWWNGVQIHRNHRVTGAATGIANHSGEEMNDTLYGLKLQNESGDVRFRNIWLKQLHIDSLGTNFGY